MQNDKQDGINCEMLLDFEDYD